MGVYIAEEWLALERDVLGKRPLISGSVEEVRAAYAETSTQLAALYPLPSAYDVSDGMLSPIVSWFIADYPLSFR